MSESKKAEWKEIYQGNFNDHPDKDLKSSLEAKSEGKTCKLHLKKFIRDTARTLLRWDYQVSNEYKGVKPIINLEGSGVALPGGGSMGSDACPGIKSQFFHFWSM